MHCIIKPIKYYNLHHQKINGNTPPRQGSFTLPVQKYDSFEKSSQNRENVPFKGKVTQTNGWFKNFNKQAEEIFNEDFNLTAHKICKILS